MKVKKIPMRTCVVTHEKCEKKDLLRVVKNNEGVVFVDDTQKANGRGAYLKKDASVIEKAYPLSISTFRSPCTTRPFTASCKRSRRLASSENMYWLSP